MQTSEAGLGSLPEYTYHRGISSRAISATNLIIVDNAFYKALLEWK